MPAGLDPKGLKSGLAPRSTCLGPFGAALEDTVDEKRVRVLVAKPNAHGEEVASAAAAQSFAEAGLEVIAAAPRASVSAIATAAMGEGAAVIALFAPALAAEALCAHLLAELKERGSAIRVVALEAGDPAKLLATGIDAAFGSGEAPRSIAEAVAALARRAPAPPSRPAIVGLDHVAICVADLEAASQVFARVLGLAPVHREYVEEQHVEATFFDLGNGASIELISPKGGNAGLEKFLEKRGPGLHHLALRVDAAEPGLQALQSLGIATLDARARGGARGHRVAFLHPKSTAGVLVELVEHPKEHA